MQVNINFHSGKHWNIESDPSANHRTMHHFRLNIKEHAYYMHEDSLNKNDSVVITTPRNQLFGHHGGDQYIFLNTNEEIKFFRVKEADSAYVGAGPVAMNHEVLKFVEAKADWTRGRNAPYWEHNTVPPEGFPNGWINIGSWHSTGFNTWVKRYIGYAPLNDLLKSDAVVWDADKDFPLRLQISVLDKGDRGRQNTFRGLRSEDGIKQSTMQVAYKKVGDKVRASSISTCAEDTGFEVHEFKIKTEWPNDLEWIVHKSGGFINFFLNPKGLDSITDVIELFTDPKDIHKVDVPLTAYVKELNKLMPEKDDDSTRVLGYSRTIEQGLMAWDEFKDLPKDKLTIVSVDGEVVMLDLIANNDHMLYNLAQTMSSLVKRNVELFDSLSASAVAWINATGPYMFGGDDDDSGCDDD